MTGREEETCDWSKYHKQQLHTSDSDAAERRERENKALSSMRKMPSKLATKCS